MQVYKNGKYITRQQRKERVCISFITKLATEMEYTS